MRDFLAEARALHASAIVLDAHVDTSLRFVDEGWQWTSDDPGIGQLSARAAAAGGLDGAFFAAWPNPAHCSGGCAERTRLLIESIHDQAARYPAALAVCTNASQIRGAKAERRFAAMIGIEGGYAIEDNLDLLEEFFARGARYMTLTWVKSLAWCGSSGDEHAARGLTDFGREVVHRMNRLGMMVDVSHVSDAAFWDVMEASSSPVIASHSSARAICAAGRNLTDEMALALARGGGLVMVNFYAAFLSDAWRSAYAAQRAEVEDALRPIREEYQHRNQPVPFTAQIPTIRRYARLLPPVPLSVLVDHFDHLLRLVGPEHVGIGTDFDGMALSVEGMESAADLPKVTAGLLERGWAAADLRGMLGENLLRVVEHTQAASTA